MEQKEQKGSLKQKFIKGLIVMGLIIIVALCFSIAKKIAPDTHDERFEFMQKNEELNPSWFKGQIRFTR